MVLRWGHYCLLVIHLNSCHVEGKTIRKNLDWVDFKVEVNVPLMLDPEVVTEISKRELNNDTSYLFFF